MGDITTPHSVVSKIPSTLRSPGAARFWLAAFAVGVVTGFAAAALTWILQVVQRFTWGGSGVELLSVVEVADVRHHLLALGAAGVVTLVGQLLLKRLTNANSIDITAAIWLQAGRLPRVKTLGSAFLSVVIVGMGVSLGREGAPKQAGAVFANFFSDFGKLSDEERRLLVACGAGAGLGAAYGVPLGGALFAIEVLRGVLALRFVLPALFISAVATGVSWLFMPNAPLYRLPEFPPLSVWDLGWALVAGVVVGLFSFGYIRCVTWAERHRPEGWKRLAMPIGVMLLIGVVSIPYPQILGNGKELTQLGFDGALAPKLLLALLFLKPAATLLSLGSGAPGGLFTPSLSFGATLGGLMGWLWSQVLPGPGSGFCALLGAGAMLAATTQGPISAMVLLMELTGGDRMFILPLLVAVGTATLVSRTLECRSIYDARLTDEQMDDRMRYRERTLLLTS